MKRYNVYWMNEELETFCELIVADSEEEAKQQVTGSVLYVERVM